VLVSGCVYLILTRLFPVPETSATWNEVDIDTLNLDVAYGQDPNDLEAHGGRRSFDELSLDHKGPTPSAQKI
jgi:NCS1 family nucleobase:cation symporter-1